MAYHTSSNVQASHMLVPEQIASLATTYQLGTFFKGYEARKPLAIIGTGLLIIVLAILVLGLLLLIAIFLHVAFGFAALFLLIVPILAVVYMTGGLIRSGNKVYIYRHGMISHRSSQTTAIPWNQVQQIFHKKSWVAALSSFRAEHVYSLTLHCAHGQSVEISSYIQEVQELGRVIEQEVTKYLLPQVMQSYRNGNTVSFGPFALSAQGIIRTANGQTLPWNEVKNVAYVGNSLTSRRNYGLRFVGITKNDGKIWVAFLETQIPNLALLFELVRGRYQEIRLC